jgi:hypothetical protein
MAIHRRTVYNGQAETLAYRIGQHLLSDTFRLFLKGNNRKNTEEQDNVRGFTVLCNERTNI